jgi:pSer/pThr/pTyr-binding forkhead associated (FHA) protein
MVRLKYLLLPIAGALSAFFSFLFASPYVKTLNRPWLKPDDPLNHFTYGTLWTNVQHAGFGILLCGSFCFILEAGRRSWPRVIQSTLLGMVIGGVSNSIADSGSDYIGIRSMHAIGQAGQFVGAACWFILVPLALSFSITLAIGPTKQRVARALYATMIAALFTFVGKIVGSVIGAGMMMSTMNVGDVMSGNISTSLEKSVPAFLIEAIFTGIALGLTMARADKNSRAGSLRLVYGRKEFRDWSLDHTANRIGSSEVEIPIRGFKGVDPVHACIFRQGNQFILDCQHAPGFVNGYPITQANLNHGDTIQLGEAQLVFYAAGAVRSVPRQSFNPQFQPHVTPQHKGYQGPDAPQSPALIAHPSINPHVSQAPDPVTPRGQSYVLVDLASKEYPLTSGVNSVGREATCSISLTSNSTVSRSHAQISIDDSGARLSDLGSANGTGHNGAKVVGEVSLKNGDSITFGSATFTFKAS